MTRLFSCFSSKSPSRKKKKRFRFWKKTRKEKKENDEEKKKSYESLPLHQTQSSGKDLFVSTHFEYEDPYAYKNKSQQRMLPEIPESNSGNKERNDFGFRTSGAGLPVCSPTTPENFGENNDYCPLTRPLVLNPSGFRVNNIDPEISKSHCHQLEKTKMMYEDTQDFVTKKTDLNHLEKYAATKQLLEKEETAVKRPSVNTYKCNTISQHNIESYMCENSSPSQESTFGLKYSEQKREQKKMESAMVTWRRSLSPNAKGIRMDGNEKHASAGNIVTNSTPRAKENIVGTNEGYASAIDDVINIIPSAKEITEEHEAIKNGEHGPTPMTTKVTVRTSEKRTSANNDVNNLTTSAKAITVETNEEDASADNDVTSLKLYESNMRQNSNSQNDNYVGGNDYLQTILYPTNFDRIYSADCLSSSSFGKQLHVNCAQDVEDSSLTKSMESPYQNYLPDLCKFSPSSDSSFGGNRRSGIQAYTSEVVSFDLRLPDDEDHRCGNNDISHLYVNSMLSMEESNLISDAGDEYCEGTYNIPVAKEVLGPSQVTRVWLDKFCVNRRYALIKPGLKGGNYKLDPLDLSVTVQENTMLEHSSDQELLFVKSTNKLDFPDTGKPLSDVYHFLPHELKLQKRIMISFPLNDLKERGRFTLMYSNTDHISRPAWRRVEKPAGKKVKVDDETPFGFFADRRYYLFLSHFCLFTVVWDDNGTPQEAHEVHMNMCGTYNPISDVLQLTFPIQITQERPSYPKMCMGELLDEDSFFLRKDLPLVCELTMLEDWEILNKKVPSKSALLNLDKLGSGPVVKISIKLGKTLNLDDPVHLKMDIIQGDEKISLFNDANVLKQLIPENQHSMENILVPPSKPSTSEDMVLGNPINRATTTFTFSNNHSSEGSRTPAYGGNESRNAEEEDADFIQRSLPNVPIDNILPHIRERHWQAEPVLPEGLKNDLCNHLNNSQYGREGWKDLLHALGRDELCEGFESYENPTEAVLMCWQNGHNIWSEFAEKLEQIGCIYLADTVRQWRVLFETSREGEGCTGDPDQTQVKRRCDD